MPQSGQNITLDNVHKPLTRKLVCTHKQVYVLVHMFLFLLSTCLFVSPIFVVGIEYACRYEQRTFVVKDSNWSVVVRLAVCLATHHGPLMYVIIVKLLHIEIILFLEGRASVITGSRINGSQITDQQILQLRLNL